MDPGTILVFLVMSLMSPGEPARTKFIAQPDLEHCVETVADYAEQAAERIRKGDHENSYVVGCLQTWAPPPGQPATDR